MPSMDHEICSSKVLTDESGERFDIVDRGDQIMLLPISNDPLEALRDEADNIDKSVAQLKKEALQTVMEEAGR